MPSSVTHIAPAFGPTGGGGGIEIDGSGFTGASLVSVGASAAPYMVMSDTVIEAQAPAHTAGVVDIVVTAPSGVSATSSADQYTYLLAATSTSLYSSANPSNSGQAVTFYAMVSSGGSGSPTGTVTFKDGTTVIGTGTLSPNGSGSALATFTTSALSVGGHTITAVYGGDAVYAASASAPANQAVNQAPTTTSISSSANPSASNQAVTFTAEVDGQFGGAPTGTVTFKDGATVLGTGTLAPGGRGSQATFTPASLLPGNHTITAVYGADFNFTGSTSAPITQTVTTSVIWAVVSNGDAGTGSLNTHTGDLRFCLTNAVSGDTIDFVLPGGMSLITLATPLPKITQSITINGYSELGASPNSNALMASGTNARIGVQIDGSKLLLLGTGFDVAAAGVTIEGLSITGFVNSGIVLEGPGGDTVAGNFIGLFGNGAFGGNGGAIIGTSAGITILNSANNRIGGTAPADSNVISGNGGVSRVPGVDVVGAGSFGNLIEGDFIGTDHSGLVGRANTRDGVLIEGGAHDNTIGGAATRAGNVISGNVQNGVEIIGVGSTNNSVLGNDIGVGADGHTSLGNGFTGVGAPLNGVSITDASGTTIGGPGGGRNIISGNAGNGIHILDTTGTNVVGTTIQNNIIGLDISGVYSFGNGADGVWLDNVGASGIIGNVISANLSAGVEIFGSGAVANLVVGNMIGTDVTGKNAIGNLGEGVKIDNGASGNFIGGTASSDINVISGNQVGVRLSGSNVTNNRLQGNLIGVNKDGIVALGNTDYGVELDSGAHNNLIGGTQAGARNVISGNGFGKPLGADVGVYLTGNGTSFNQIVGDSIGTDLAGTLALGNTYAGIWLDVGADSNTIGAAGGALNWISANGRSNPNGPDIGYGLDIQSTNNTIDFSYVGLNANGGALNNKNYRLERAGVTNHYGSPPTYLHQ